MGIGMQALIGLIIVAGLAFAPLSRGPMLLVPLTGKASGDMARIAFGHGAVLLGPGPIRGSLVMIGNGRAMVFALLGHGVIAITAPPALCGDVALDGVGR